MGKSQKQARRELIEKMQRDQAKADRRRTILIVVVAAVVGLAIIAYPAIRLIQDSRIKNTAIAETGMAMSAAGCDAPTTEKASGNQDHQPDGTAIKYAQSPPSNGSHYQTWAEFGKTFYDASDRPPVGNLVHNLEHGYTILWYNDTIAGDSDQMEQIERIAKGKLPEVANGKFIAAPFHASDGAAWPAGKNIAFSHWGGPTDTSTEEKFASSQSGHRQFCTSVSGEALSKFIEKYPASDSPEPQGG